MTNLYRKKSKQEIEPWRPGYDMTRVSVSPADEANGSPKPGDMIAINPQNADDKWLIAAKYFADNYEPVEE